MFDEPIRNSPFALKMKKSREVQLGLVCREVVPKVITVAGFSGLKVNKYLF